MEAVAEINSQHPAQQITVQGQYPELFQYLVEDTPEGTDSVLTLWEMEHGKPDLKEMIAACEVLYMARLEQERGHHDLDSVLEQYIIAGEEDVAPAEETKLVPWQGVPVLYFEKGLFQTVLEHADYGESDLLDRHHTLFLKNVTDQQVYNNVNLLEQVTELVNFAKKRPNRYRKWHGKRYASLSSATERRRFGCCVSISNRPMDGMPDSWSSSERRGSRDTCCRTLMR